METAIMEAIGILRSKIKTGFVDDAGQDRNDTINECISVLKSSLPKEREIIEHAYIRGASTSTYETINASDYYTSTFTTKE